MFQGPFKVGGYNMQKSGSDQSFKYMDPGKLNGSFTIKISVRACLVVVLSE